MSCSIYVYFQFSEVNFARDNGSKFSVEVRLSSYQTLRISVLKASDLTDIYKLCRNRVIQSQDTNNFHLPLTQVDLNCGRFVPGPFHTNSFRPKVISPKFFHMI